jgi:hypothetical protein
MDYRYTMDYLQFKKSKNTQKFLNRCLKNKKNR